MMGYLNVWISIKVLIKILITSWRAWRCPRKKKLKRKNNFWKSKFRICIAYKHPPATHGFPHKNFSPIGQAVLPAIRNIYAYKCLVLLYRFTFQLNCENNCPERIIFHLDNSSCWLQSFRKKITNYVQNWHISTAVLELFWSIVDKMKKKVSHWTLFKFHQCRLRILSIVRLTLWKVHNQALKVTNLLISSPSLLLTIPLSPLQHCATPPPLHHSATPPLPRDGNRFIFSVFRFIYPIWESRFAFKTNYDFFFKMTILKFTQTIILQFISENFSMPSFEIFKTRLKKIKCPSLPLPFLQPGTCIVIHSCHNHSSQLIFSENIYFIIKY